MSSDADMKQRCKEAQISVSHTRRGEITPDKKSKLTKGSRKRKRRYSSSDEEDSDTSIDTKLKQSAMRNKLTPQNVKNILQKVVRNDHVLAIVKLKEEELERQEQVLKDSRTVTDTTSTTPESKDSSEIVTMENAIPKLTRSKAKALNKYPLPVTSFNHSEPDSEVVALIREELHSDDDDEEYQPGEDDVESDDDVNTTTSDVDSQPATPLSQIDNASEEQLMATYSQDGLFKIPRARNDSTASHSEQEYIIAKQTRSKISLTETPIEAIESTFKAPDATLDMYQTESDLDPTWYKFLTECNMPLSMNIESSEIENDEDADPDYCPAIVDAQQDDREEFQYSNVPKKEVKDLYKELNEFFGFDFNDLSDLLSFDESNSKQAAATEENLNESLITPVKQSDEPLTEHKEQDKMQSTQPAQPLKPKDCDRIESPTLLNQETTYFDPNAISTPGKPDFKNNHLYTGHQLQQQSFDSCNSTLLSVNDAVPPNQYSYSINRYSFSPLQENTTIYSPIMTLAGNSRVSSNNISMPYNNQLVINMPAEAPTTLSNMISSVPSNCQIQYLNQQMEGGPISKRPGCRSKRSRFKSAVYKELEQLHPNAVDPQIFLNADERGFTAEQRRILENQLRTHVQLATQSYLQLYGHPEFYLQAPKNKKFLTDLVPFVEKDNGKQLSVYNLKPALKLIENWEYELSQDKIENTELFTHLQNEINKFRKNSTYTMQFHERILEVISASKVFIYPERLPSIPFRLKTSKPSEYFPGEDYLIAFLLEHFFVELRHKMIDYKFAKPKEVTLTSVCQNISAHLGYFRPWKSIYDYVRLRRDCRFINPIKFYFLHQKAPPARHCYEIFNPNMVREPAKQPLNVLSGQWARYVEKLIGFSQDTVLSKTNGPSVAIYSQIDEEQTLKRQRISDQKEVQVEIFSDNKNTDESLIQVKIIYEQSTYNDSTNNLISPVNHKSQALNDCRFICDVSNIGRNLDKGQTLLTSYFQPIRRTIDLHSESCLSMIDTDEPGNLIICDNDKTDQKWLLRQSKQICRKYIRLNINKDLIRKRIQHFLVEFGRKARKEYWLYRNFFCRNNNISLIYRWLITFHRFTTEFVNYKVKFSKNKTTTKMANEALVANRRIQKILTDTTGITKEANDENAIHAGQQPSDVGTKRLPKNQRTTDNNRLLLTENAQDSSEKEFLFAQRFLDRVEETFINRNEHHKFVEFLEILRNFRENQPQKSGADLYLTLEKFFMPDYPEHIELFLSFLTPSDAVEINKSMEHFLTLNLSKFLNKLNIFFQKQPAQIRKVLACLKELSVDPDVTIERIRSKILPLLKGNQLLIDWFLQCVGPDKCESSKDEYETLVLRKGNELFDDDQFEYIPQSGIVADPNDNPCHIRYINGRIFYGNRFPLPAKLSFSATPCSLLTNESIQSNKHLVIVSDDKCSQYRCIHNIKEFVDNKLRDKPHSELEPVCSAGENSDEEQQYITPVEKTDDKNCIDDEAENGFPFPNTEYILCDNTLLRAHSVRLNPSMHTSLIHYNADLLNKLKVQDPLSGDNSNKELKLSPKKQSLTKISTNVQMKKCKIHSPNAKKAATVGCKSPNSKKSVHENVENIFSSAQVTQELNAIQTAKRLKRIFDVNDQTASCSQLNHIEDTTKRSSILGSKSQKSHMNSKPIKKQKRAHECYEPGDEYMDKECTVETVKQDDTKTHNENDSQKSSTLLEIQWTREEDRLLLEQIKAGLVSNTENIAGFEDRFPNKTQDQIRDRIDFLFDFLTKLRNKK